MNLEVIHTYSRAQAIEDGVLVDVSEAAREAGITFPVAITAGAWAKAVSVPKSNKIESESGRLWDVVWMLRVAIKASRNGGSRIEYKVKVGRRWVYLKALCGPGDSAEPVLTILLPDED